MSGELYTQSKQQNTILFFIPKYDKDKNLTMEKTIKNQPDQCQVSGLRRNGAMDTHSSTKRSKIFQSKRPRRISCSRCGADRLLVAIQGKVATNWDSFLSLTLQHYSANIKANKTFTCQCSIFRYVRAHVVVIFIFCSYHCSISNSSLSVVQRRLFSGIGRVYLFSRHRRYSAPSSRFSIRRRIWNVLSFE